MSTVADQLSKRIEHLEASVRRHRLFLGLALGSGALALIWLVGMSVYKGNLAATARAAGAEPSAEVRTRSVEILDASGRAVVVLGTDAMGGVVAIQRPDGKQVVRLASLPAGGTFALNDNTGAVLVQAGPFLEKGEESFGGAMRLFDQQHRARVTVAGGPVMPGIRVLSESGSVAASLHDMMGYGYLSLNNEKGFPVVQAGESPLADLLLGTRSRIRVLDGGDVDHKKVLFEIGLNQNGGVASVSQRNGITTGYFGAAEAGAGLTLLNMDLSTVLVAAALREGGSLALSNGSGQGIFRAFSDNGSGAMAVLSNNGKVGVLSAVHENGGYFSVLNTAGQEVCQMYADAYGEGLIGAFNREGTGKTPQPK